jgi:dihydroorotase (multifunctional complex type)
VTRAFCLISVRVTIFDLAKRLLLLPEKVIEGKKGLVSKASVICRCRRRFEMGRCDLAVRGGRIVTPDGTIREDLYVKEGKVVGLGRLDVSPRETVDARGLLVLPGMIDAHVHFMDPGDTSREDFPTGSAAAAVAGVTTVIEHSHSSPVYTAAELREKVSYLKNRSVVDFGLGAHFPVGAVDSIRDLVREGAALIKVFTCTTHGIKAVDPGNLYKAMSLFAKLDVPFLVHAEDESLTRLAEKELKSAGREDGMVIPEWRNAIAEEVAVSAVGHLAQASGAKTVIAHCSHTQIVDTVAGFQSGGARIFAEACPQYFVLKENEVGEMGGFRKFTPPARAKTRVDLDQMWQRLRGGSFSYIASDHAPSNRKQKTAGSIWEVPFGLPGIDTTLPVMLDSAARGRLTYPQLVGLYAKMPAVIYGLYPKKGALLPGSDADFVLVEPKAMYRLEDSAVISKAGWTPFAGRALKGKVLATFVRGRRVAENGRCVEGAGWGRFVRPGSSKSGD